MSGQVLAPSTGVNLRTENLHRTPLAPTRLSKGWTGLHPAVQETIACSFGWGKSG